PDHQGLRAYIDHRHDRRRDHWGHPSRLEITMRAIFMVVALTVALLLAGCGGTDRRHSVNPAGTAATPPFIELRSDTSAGTIHFPRGLYSLDSEDHHGYYYR